MVLGMAGERGDTYSPAVHVLPSRPKRIEFGKSVMIKEVIKQVFKQIGIDLRRTPPTTPHPVVHHGIEVLLDVGANEGQFAQGVRDAGYRGRIISFEPLPEAFLRLKEASQADPQWVVHSRCALGSVCGQVKINIAGNSVSSSIMPMLESHSSAAPRSKYVGTADTEVITLDSVFENYCRPNDRVFLKIDTQGFESEVLRGCSSTLKYIQGVQLELSVVPLYGGQELYPYFFELFRGHGFELWSIIPGFSDIRSGQTLQFDAVFMRTIEK
jgi:FkbM family methyltransferase